MQSKVSRLAQLFLGWAPFIASAGLVAFGVHLGLREPALGVGLAILAVIFWLPGFRAKKRLERLFLSGDVPRIMRVWESSVPDMGEPRTMAPLLRATALATYGLTEQARRALSKAERGAAWDAAIEHRLFLETLLEAFDGERDKAVDHASEMAALPLPASPWVRGRARLLRRAAGALARAFAQHSEPGDEKTLARAAAQNPLLFWAMRYAQAVACLQQGHPSEVRKLLGAAPEWPESSVFRAFHDELWGLSSPEHA
jgi:hypothetical protein